MTAADAVRLTAAYDVALLDLDGVVYLGAKSLPGVPIAVAGLGKMRLSYVTNNATRTPAEVWQQLAAMGLPGSAANVVTSCQAAAEVLRGLVDPGSAVLVVGAPALFEAVAAAGFSCVSTLEESPVAVVQGLSFALSYADLTEAALAIRTGLPWVATNTDATLPTSRGLQPGNGAIVSALTTATGRTPVAAGKPQPALFETAARAIGAQRPLVVGDRLDTDIAGAHHARMDSLLVLSGVSSAADALSTAPSLRPNYVARDVGGLADEHPEVGGAGLERECRGWRASSSSAGLTLDGDGDAIDALRALMAVPIVASQIRPGGPAALRALQELGIPTGGDTV
ncbi:MAG: glycerol-phosphatase [Solirubrobacteraceae bacterium]|nr:glycerol-phosphatase [Solirubrobacteraceae bacterium]